MKVSTTTVTSVGLCLLALAVGTYSNVFEPVFIQDANPSFLCLPKNVSDISGRVYSHMNVEHSPYLKGMDCTMTLNTHPGKRINIRFDYFDLAPGWDSSSNQCRTEGTSPTDSFRIYESGMIARIRSDILQPDVTICGGTGKFPPDYQSSGNVITVRFTTDDISTADAGIKFVYTSFTPPEEGTTDCFKCEDGTMCIDQALLCNGMPNCNDDSDESNSLCKDGNDNIFQQGLDTLGIKLVAIIGAAIGLVFLITIILCIACCCCCGKSNDSIKKQYRAPPTPRPGSYPSHASNYSSYSSSASTTAGRPPYPMHYPPAYPPIQNGGYAVAYNQTNGRMEFPHKV
ncbi:LOW QUALITY PROTEIN: uncharacterized protein [Amphiura filiformis]|uniref:LOW QUALITY PROTEIN: uncharacterized protein n=1 Tax=Amphiura filiformis TaxID=82378 RepID=UPI003B21C4DF